MNEKRATIAALTTYFIFGFTFLATRVALDHTSASVLLSLRFTISFLTMAVMAIIARIVLGRPEGSENIDGADVSDLRPSGKILSIARLELKGKPVGKLIAMGFSQPIAYFIFETLGIHYTNSSFAGIIISLIPIVATIMSIVFLGEKFAWWKFAWILCSVAGVTLLSVMQGSSGAIQIKGVFFMILATIAAAAFSTLSRHTSEYFSPFERSFVMMAMGFVVFVGYSIVDNGANFIPATIKAITDINVMAPILYLSILSSVIAFLCLHYATTYLEVSKVTSYTNLQPIISLFAGVVFLGEPISFIHIIAVAMILLGVYKISKG